MKAIEQFFPLELFIMLYSVVLTIESVTIHMKAIKYFFPIILFITLCSGGAWFLLKVLLIISEGRMALSYIIKIIVKSRHIFTYGGKKN